MPLVAPHPVLFQEHPPGLGNITIYWEADERRLDDQAFLAAAGRLLNDMIFAKMLAEKLSTEGLHELPFVGHACGWAQWLSTLADNPLLEPSRAEALDGLVTRAEGRAKILWEEHLAAQSEGWHHAKRLFQHQENVRLLEQALEDPPPIG